MLTYLGKGHERAQKDYIEIPTCETTVGVNHILLEYRSAAKGFYVKDNGSEAGTFLKIERPLKLKQGYIFAFGESSMAIASLEEAKILLKFLGGSKEDKSL